MSGERPVRFLLDENLSDDILLALRRNAVDITSINELRLKGISDNRVLALAGDMAE